MEIKTLPLAAIIPCDFNTRKHYDEEKIKELAMSIKEKGIIEPIMVRQFNGKYQVVFGERRCRAAKLAGIKDIPAIIKQLSDEQVLEYQVIENLQREDVHPLEEAEGYETLLKKYGNVYKTIDDIAAKIGKSKGYVYGRLKLCELIPENRKLFYEGKFSPSVALLVARIPAHLQKEAGSHIAKGNYDTDHEPLSYRQAQEYIHEKFMLQLKEAPFDTNDKTLCAKVGPCVTCLKRTGAQKELFPDIQNADVCTDPVCFKAKSAAYMQRTIAKAKETGQKVLSLKECKEVFPYSGSSPEKGYIRLDAICYDDPKRRSYKQLGVTHKDAEIIYATHPERSEVVALITKKTAAQIIKKAGVKVGFSDSPGRDNSKNFAKAKTENRIRFAKRDFWISKVSTAKDRRCMNVVILDILLDDLGVSEANELLPFKAQENYYRTWEISKLYELGDEEVQKLIIKVISKKSEVLNDDDLEFLSGKLGFNIAKDYVITESYLQAMTKDQLGKLAKEIGMIKALEGKNVDCSDMGTMKKPNIIKIFLDWKELKGKVPKELAK